MAGKPSHNFWITAVHSIPDPAKPNKVGEDASYVSQRCIAVADGIFWDQAPFDVTKYSRELMTNVGDALVTLPAETRNHPQAIMLRAAAKCTSQGGATCCVATLDPVAARVYSANLGDSGYYVLRFNASKGKVEIVGKSRDVVKVFNTPRILGMGEEATDYIEVDVHEVKDKDLLLMYTDGFSFNIFPEQIISFLKPFLALPDLPDLDVVTEMLAEKAFKQSLDPFFDSPFAIKAAENMLGLRWDGGRPNDITVVAAQISILGPDAQTSQ